MSASRLISLLLLLQSRPSLTAAEAADELEVSTRTVYRDIDALSAAGIPVFATRGRGGGIRLLHSFQTILTGVTADEADALLLTAIPVAAAQLGLGSVVAARLRILASLTPELRARAAKAVDRFYLDPSFWFGSLDDGGRSLTVLARAVWDSRLVELIYRTAGRQTTRVLQPLGLVLKAASWYLIAADKDRVRTYRVSRVKSAKLLMAHFERPVGFDLPAFWSSARRAFERAVPEIEILVRVAPDHVEDAVRIIGPTSVKAQSQSSTEGSVTVRATFRWVDEAVSTAFHLAMIGTVIAPTSVRRKLREGAKRILDEIPDEVDPDPSA